MSIFRGTGGSGNSTDDSIVSAVTEQAGIATTKAGEAATSASNANTSATNAATSATTASTKATEAASSATTASTKATEANTAKTGAEAAKTAAEAARDTALVHANTANNTHVQTVSGIATEVQNLDSIKTDITGVNTIKSDVTTVAGISSNVTTVAADASDIGTVATNITNVNNVGDNISNVNSVAGNATNINTVAGDASDIGTVSSNISNVNTVAGISSDVTTVAGLESKMDTVIADASDIGAVANNIDDVTTVAGINSEVDTVAGISAKVTTVADNITDVQNADTNAANASASASQAANSATAASASATTASTKATEASNSATAASNSASTASTKATEAAGSATTATTKATEASTSATDAATSATTATTKASEAASSATAASGSATTATTKASEADASATSAALSATDSANAASTWTNYYSTYLGAADAPPTVDVKGNALKTGAFYYDTGAGSNTVGLYVYNGSTWVYSTNYNNVTAPYSLSQHLSTNGKNICFGDTDKAKFGASDDLEIWHDGTASRIKDSGTGDLRIQGSTRVRIENADGADMIFANSGGSVDLYHDGSKKVCTTSTGLDVTGGITASGNVGIGTSSPESGLHVQNNSLSNGVITVERNTKIKGTITAGNSTGLTIDVNNTQGGTEALRFSGNGSERMRIDSSGRVGIGTTNPTSHLEIRGSSGGNDKQLRLSTGSTTYWDLGRSSVNGNFEITEDSGNTYFVIDKTVGNVGIGTTNPSSPLDIQFADATAYSPTASNSSLEVGNSNSSANTNFSSIQMFTDGNGRGIVNLNAINNTTASSADFSIQTRHNGTLGERLRIGSSGKLLLNTATHTLTDSEMVVSSEYSASGTTTGGITLSSRQGGSWRNSGIFANGTALTFTTGDNGLNGAQSSSERMRIDSSGNVGIGTSSPLKDLNVSNTTGSSEIMISTSDTGTGSLEFGDVTSGTVARGFLKYDHSDNSLQFGSAQTERMRIDSSGNVGIGTSSPSSRLAIHGAADKAYLEQTNTANTQKLEIGNAYSLYTGGNGAVSAVASDLILAFATNDTERMRVDSLGNVLVGKTSADNTTAGCRVRGDGFASFVRSGAEPALINRLTNDGSLLTLQKDGSTVGFIGTRFSDMYLGTGDTTLRFNDADDRVNPADATGNARDAVVDLGNTTSRFKDLYLSGAGYIPDVRSTSNQYITHNTGNFLAIRNSSGAERMRIDSSGNVGIGTSSPSEQLHIYNTDHAKVEIEGGASGDASLLLTETGSTGFRLMYDGGDNKLLIGGGTAGTFSTKVAVDRDSGNVGIGTSSPTAKATIEDADFARLDLNLSNSTGTSITDVRGLVEGTEKWRIGKTTSASDDFTIGVGGSEAMRIDSSGNLLVGKTATGTDDGVQIEPVGAISLNRDSSTLLYLNRKTSDGTIVDFRRDGATVGSIGTTYQSGVRYMHIAGASTGIGFYSGGIFPCDNSGTFADNSKDLGSTSVRFDDIHATNGTIQTSDRNEKQGIRELLDAEQRVATACKGLLRAFKWNSAVEAKGDEARIHFGIIAQDLQDAFTTEGLDAGDYAMFINTTWIDEETGEERSRMGVRYSELLAFIISAI